MQINTQKHDVDVSGMMNQRKFTVDAGAHIMAVLSGLYTNPVDAMVREYLTNMYDAYVALKRIRPDAVIVPPVLHLPSALDGNLTFRDFGVGMSLETVWNVYATYGASTKNGSNDEVGGFGLGSKTAFCYNGGASWTIESRYAGQKHIFMAYIGEDGVPNLSHVTSIPCDEPSGLTISIPIRREDHRACLDAATKYVPYFPMELTVEGATIGAALYKIKASTWGVRPWSRHNTQSGTSRVIMGNVPYRVNLSDMWSQMEWTQRKFLSENSFDIFVNIGDVDIVPSRDDLKYTDRTKQAIQRAVTRIFAEIGPEVNKQLDGCTDAWWALVKYHNMNEITHLHDVVKSITWRGQTLGTSLIAHPAEEFLKLDGTATITKYAVTSSDRATIEVFESPSELSMSLKPNTFIIIDDLPKGGATMARALLYQKLVHKTIAGRTSRYGHTPGHALLMQTKLTPAQISTFFGGMPLDRITTTSALKGIVPVPAGLTPSKDTIYRWSGTSWDARVNVPVGTTMYYLPLTKDAYTKRFSFVNNRYGSQKDAVGLILKAALALNIKVETLYGIKSDDVKNFDASWVNLVTTMEAEMVKQIKSNATAFALVFGVGSKDINSSGTIKNLFNAITHTKLDKVDPIFADFVTTYNAYINATVSSQVYTYNLLVSRIPSLDSVMKNIVASTTVPNLSLLSSQIMTKYPMLSVLVEVLTKSRYGYSPEEVFHNNSGKVLAYVQSIS